MLVTMTDKELYRLGIIQRVFDRALLQRDAADILKLSVRQVQRLVRLYRTDGATAFASSRRGRPANNRIDEETRCKKDIQITLDNDVLMVRGEKRQEQEKKEGGFHRVERSYGSFQRALNLPDDANQDSIKASFKNGVLTVTIDKREVSAPKQGRSIPING
ncbi:molecular chaperone (small heat shock protein) [Klebsiella variicola]|nr:molecular chaperone (small heat shock protein) [Klebsiella variicola]